KVKAANFCGALPIKERAVPAMMLILRRHRDGIQAGNQFETQMQTFLDGLPPKERDALQKALAAYDALPKASKDCSYETRFDTWPDGKPLDREFIRKNVAFEIVALGRLLRYGYGADTMPTPGKVRYWEREFDVSGSEPKGNVVTKKGPWPWI